MVEREALTLTVDIAARPETVFRFFTDPESFNVWMGGAMGKASITPEPGGALRVEFPAFGATPARSIAGEITTLEPPRRFSFTWGYEGDESLPPGTSAVQIELVPTAAGARLTLLHEGLPTETHRLAHRGGFRIYLSMLAAEAAAAEHAAGLTATVAAWFEAWSTEDPRTRVAALERCMAEEGEFRHPFAAIRGLSDLAGHIASSRMMMRGIRLEPRGEPELCHGYVRFGWQATGDQGVVSTGENFAILDGDGRFLVVAGFQDSC